MEERLHWLHPKNDLYKPEEPGHGEYEIYKKRLDEAFDGDRIDNIALIGDKGSGKSSLLHSYNAQLQEKAKKRETTGRMVQPGKKGLRQRIGKLFWPEAQQKKKNDGFLFVSLIDFESRDDKKAVDSSGEGQEALQRRLERSVLCQLMARCSKNDLRYCSLSGIRDVPKRPREGDAKKTAVYWFVVLGLMFGLMFEDRFGAVARAFGLPNSVRVTIHAFGYGLLFLLLFRLGLSLWRKGAMTFRLNRLTLKGNKTEAEFLANSEKHCLEQYKFEAVHILDMIAESCDHTVVFEDMERLDSDMCVEILVKLKELNCLLNTRRRLRGGNDKPVRFIYVIGDKIFSSENRVKFFDVVIPVLPVLNSGNYYSILRKRLEECGVSVYKAPVRDLLDETYGELKDYRMMLSMVNEYLLLRDLYCYHGCKTKEMLDPHEQCSLLALAVCKTIDPKYCSNIFQGTVKTELEKTEQAHTLTALMKNRRWLTRMTIMRVQFPKEEIFAQWIRALKTEDDAEAVRRARLLRTEINVQKGPNAMLGKIRDVPELRELMTTTSNYKLAAEIGKICFGDVHELIQSLEPQGCPEHFLNHLVLLLRYQSDISDYVQGEEAEKLRQWCLAGLEQVEQYQPDDQNARAVWDREWNEHWGPLVACCLRTTDGISDALLSLTLGEKTLKAYIDAHQPVQAVHG